MQYKRQKVGTVAKRMKDRQYYKFSLYGFLKNLRFFEQFLILFFLEKGIDYVKIGLLYSIREITILILEIPSGLVADAVGRRKTMVGAFAMYIASFTIFYFSNHFGMMALAMLFFAFGDAFRSGVHKAMIFHYLEKTGQTNRKVEYYGHTRSWSQTGSAISSLIAAFAVFYYGSYRIIFAATVIPYLTDMLLILSYPHYLDGEIKPLEADSLKQKFRLVLVAVVQSVKEIKLLRTLSNLSLYTGYYKAVKDYLQPVIMTFALSVPLLTNTQWNAKQKTALFVGIFYFFIYLLTAWMSRSAGRFHRLFKQTSKPMNSTMIVGLVAGVVLGIFYNQHLYFWAVVGFLFIMMIENLRKPIGIAYVAEQTDKRIMASVLSVESQAKSLFAAVIAPIAGFFADRVGPGKAVLIVSVLLLLLTPIYWLRKGNKL